MRIKLDENLPAGLTPILNGLGHETDTVAAEGMTGETDAGIWQVAQRDRRFLMTQDLDFSDVRRFRPGTHYGLLLLRLRDPNRSEIIQVVTSIFESQDVTQWIGCLIVADGRRLRILRPDNQ